MDSPIDRSGIFNLCNKKAGNARRKLLAYRSFCYIQTTRNGEVEWINFLSYKKVGNAHSITDCFAHLHRYLYRFAQPIEDFHVSKQ